MFYALLANLFLLAHLAFIFFAVLGGLFALKWPRAWMLHAPALSWACLVEFLLLDCPLTSMENDFREAAGQTGYETGFIDHFISYLIYPGLPPEFHIFLGIVLGAFNIAVYGYLIKSGSIAFGRPATGPQA
ncbi:MAG: DUF2784 domain-containing protein [Acidobacteriota bacterium]|nr:MAG: DUF2784 domain-containing protein [Acidobacteriota bacterium]